MYKVFRHGGRLPLFFGLTLSTLSCSTEPPSREKVEVVPDTHSEGEVWYRDSDEDGWGRSGASRRATTTPEGYTDVPGDCDDDDPSVHPNADEALNGRDDDCDGVTDPAPR